MLPLLLQCLLRCRVSTSPKVLSAAKPANPETVRYVLTVESEGGRGARFDLARALKALRRGYGLRVVEARRVEVD